MRLSAPVSYTHLDVYKRQGLDRDLLIIVRIIFQANIQSAIIQLGKGIAADVDFIHAGKVIACFHLSLIHIYGK